MDLIKTATDLNRWLSGPAVLPRLQRLAILYGLLFLATTIIVSIITPGLVYGSGGVIGADFLAFYTAGDMTLQGRAVDAYDFAAFDAALQSRVENDHLGMMWQYPPLMFFVAGLLALMPYKISFWVWMTATSAAFAWALNRIVRTVQPDWADRRVTLLLILASPISVSIMTNGQISLLTAALLMLAVFRPRRDWWVAGLAAGLLTVKPQLGLLIPLAYLVAGAWRAFAVAAVTGLALHLLSVLVFGPESLSAFLAAVARLQADVAGSGVHTPPVSMTTVFGQLRLWDIPAGVALPVHYVAAVLVIAVVVSLWWRRHAEADQAVYLAALLSSGAILVTPYAYAYEMTALAIAAIWMAFQPGRYRQLSTVILAGFWLALALRRFLPPDFVIQIPFLTAISVFLLLAHAGFSSSKTAASKA